MKKSWGRNCAQALCKCRDSFYSLNSRQVTHQTTQSQKQKGHRWVEISYKDGIVGVKAARWVRTVMDKDVEKAQSRSHVSLLLQEFSCICVYRFFWGVDYVENTADGFTASKEKFKIWSITFRNIIFCTEQLRDWLPCIWDLKYSICFLI